MLWQTLFINFDNVPAWAWGDTQGSKSDPIWFIWLQIISNQTCTTVVPLAVYKWIKSFSQTSGNSGVAACVCASVPESFAGVYTQMFCKWRDNSGTGVAYWPPRVLMRVPASRPTVNCCPYIHMPTPPDLCLGATSRQLNPPPPEQETNCHLRPRLLDHFEINQL